MLTLASVNLRHAKGIELLAPSVRERNKKLSLAEKILFDAKRRRFSFNEASNESFFSQNKTHPSLKWTILNRLKARCVTHDHLHLSKARCSFEASPLAMMNVQRVGRMLKRLGIALFGRARQSVDVRLKQNKPACLGVASNERCVCRPH